MKHEAMRCASLAIGACLATAAWAGLLWAGDAAIGRSFLEQGEVREAREYIRRAFRTDSTSAETVLAYARVVCDVGEVKRLYQGLIGDEGLGSAQRAEAYIHLGQLHYSEGSYDDAYSSFEKAWRLEPTSLCNEWLVRAALNKGDLQKAEALLVPALSADEGPVTSEELYYLGNTYFLRGEPDRALSCYRKASRFRHASHTAPSLAGAYASAKQLGKNQLAAMFEQRLASQYGFFLELPLVDSLRNTGAELSEEDIDERGAFREGGGRTPGAFALQVGAFASVENARRLQRLLQKTLPDVTISRAEIGDKVLHRVRVGAFATQKDAAAFGRRHLKRKGISFRVVKR